MQEILKVKFYTVQNSHLSFNKYVDTCMYHASLAVPSPLPPQHETADEKHCPELLQ